MISSMECSVFLQKPARAALVSERFSPNVSPNARARSLARALIGSPRSLARCAHANRRHLQAGDSFENASFAFYFALSELAPPISRAIRFSLALLVLRWNSTRNNTHNSCLGISDLSKPTYLPTQ